MRTAVRALIVAALSLACVQQTSAATPGGSWSDKVQVRARVKQGEPARLVVTLEPVAGWSINAAYPGVKVTFEEKTPVERRELKKPDGRFEGRKKGEKAARVVFETPLTAPAPAAVKGTFKAVICNAETCSPPFSGAFEAKVAPAGEATGASH